MIRSKTCVVLLLVTAVMPVAHSQEDGTSDRWQQWLDERKPKAVLERGAAFYGYPGGMPFHTAFHRGITTRYILLKTATELPAVRNYLDLNARQLGAVSKLQPVEVNLDREDNANALADPNAEPDEQRTDPDYFRFLSDEQLGRLDLLALTLDGYPALARLSVAERLELSATTRADIASILMENRTEIFLPRLRANFAAQLPPDYEYANSEFEGKFSAHLNHEILDVLKPREAKLLTEWLASAPPLDEPLEAIQKLAPLPGGLNSLATRWDPLRTKTRDEQ